jgi:hypothetical protein
MILVNVIPGCATWRRPGIHTPDRGYGFPGSRSARPGMTKVQAIKLFHFFVSHKIVPARGIHPGTDCSSLFVG